MTTKVIILYSFPSVASRGRQRIGFRKYVVQRRRADRKSCNASTGFYLALYTRAPDRVVLVFLPPAHEENCAELYFGLKCTYLLAIRELCDTHFVTWSIKITYLARHSSSSQYQTGNQNHSFKMAYRRGFRDPYEPYFSGRDAREVTVHRVVNIVEKRPRPPVDYDRGYHDEQWYGAPRHYQDAREYHGGGGYSHTDRRYYDDTADGHYHRDSPQHEGPYPRLAYSRDDLRHQLGSRKNGRGGPYFRSRGRGSGAPRRGSPPIIIKRDRSPVRRESLPPAPVRSGSNTSNRSFSPDREKSLIYQQTQQKHKPSVQTSVTPSSSVAETPHISAPKEKTPSVAETVEEQEEEEEEEQEVVEEYVEDVEEEEVVAAASMEPKPTPEEDVKARRLEAIKAKALEIEKHYRADCETFRTVVKMLVDKEPTLDNLLQAPLDQNLSEIRERCLESLRHFVKELDEVLKQPDTSA